MKKDKKWLMNEIECMGSEVSENYPHNQVVDRDEVLDLVDQLDESEKVVIPKIVADWWENRSDTVVLYGGKYVGKKHKFYLISEFNEDGLDDHLLKVEVWIDENESTFLDLVNGKPYEIEKEKLYIVQLPTNCEDGLVILDVRGIIWNDAFPSEYKMTEQRIKDIDERYWAFAVEVAE